MKPSEYILELRKSIAKQRLEEIKREPSYAFLQAVSGVKEEEQLQHLETDDKTTFSAILAYLDQTQRPVRMQPQSPLDGPRTGQAAIYLLAILASLGLAAIYAYAVWQGWLR